MRSGFPRVRSPPLFLGPKGKNQLGCCLLWATEGAPFQRQTWQPGSQEKHNSLIILAATQPLRIFTRLAEYFNQCARETMEDEDVRLLHHCRWRSFPALGRIQTLSWRTRLLSTIIPQLCHRATDVIPSLQLYLMAPVSPPQLYFLFILKITIYYLCYGNSKFDLSLSLTGYHFQPRGKGHRYSSSRWFNHTWGEELMPVLTMALRLFYY